MAYGIALFAGTLMGMAGVATLTTTDHPPAPRMPAEMNVKAHQSGPLQPTFMPSIDDVETTRTLVHVSDTPVFTDRAFANSASTDAPVDEVAKPLQVKLPVGQRVRVTLVPINGIGSEWRAGELIAGDAHWIQLRDTNGDALLVNRARVQYMTIESPSAAK